MKKIAALLGLGLWFLSSCIPSDSQYFEVVMKGWTMDNDCYAGQDERYISSENDSYDDPATFEFFNGPGTRRFVTTDFSSGVQDWQVGDTLAGTSMIPGLASKYAGESVVNNTKDSMVGGAHSTSTHKVTITVESTPDTNFITGTITVYESQVCRASSSNCPSTWRDWSCTRRANYEGHKSHMILKVHAI